MSARRQRQMCIRDRVWSCLLFIGSELNYLARQSERGKKTRQTEEDVERQHQGMDRRKKWNWCARANLHFKKKAQAGNELSNILIKSSQAKKKPSPPLVLSKRNPTKQAYELTNKLEGLVS